MAVDGSPFHAFGATRLDFLSVTSTFDIAREYAVRGAPHGTLVTASHQTQGRGRRGAPWVDLTGASALLSFILRPIAPADLWRAPFAASLACLRAIHFLGGSDARVKWPNDLTFHGRKVGGLMIKSVTGSGSPPALLLGIGINVAQPSFSGAEQFAAEPTSLWMEADRARSVIRPTVEETIDAVCGGLDSAWNEYIEGAGGDVIGAWRAHQSVGHKQNGIGVDSGCPVTGIYRDVRTMDGAGLIEIDGCAGLTSILPSPS